MVGFLFVLFAYVSVLLWYRPAPESLRSRPITFAENYRQIRLSLYVGIALVTIFFLTSNFDFLSLDESLFEIFALSNRWEFAQRWPYQFFTHHFIHLNVVHLLSNVFLLMLLSTYERRVGIKRYMEVLAVSAIISTPSIFLMSANSAVCGISGGLCGLAGAYFTDQRELSTIDWLKTTGLFAMIALIMTVAGELQSDAEALTMKVDHWGHLLGALGGIAYCRVWQLPSDVSLNLPISDYATKEKRETLNGIESNIVGTAIDKLRYSGNENLANELHTAATFGSTGGEIVNRVGMFFISLNKSDIDSYNLIEDEAEVFFERYQDYFSKDVDSHQKGVKTQLD